MQCPSVCFYYCFVLGLSNGLWISSRGIGVGQFHREVDAFVPLRQAALTNHIHVRTLATNTNNVREHSWWRVCTGKWRETVGELYLIKSLIVSMVIPPLASIVTWGNLSRRRRKLAPTNPSSKVKVAIYFPKHLLFLDLLRTHFQIRRLEVVQHDDRRTFWHHHRIVQVTGLCLIKILNMDSTCSSGL